MPVNELKMLGKIGEVS